MRAQIHPWEIRDGERMQELHRALDEESTFMLAAPGERLTAPRPEVFRLVAERDGLLVGHIDVRSLPWARARGRGHIILGVRAAFHRQGIGRTLLEGAIKEACERGMWRLEMTTMIDNVAALNLYLSCGFLVEGLRRDSLRIDGEPVHEYYPGRSLP